MTDELQIRIQNGDGPTLIYLPGTHGDWTLNAAFRREIKGRARLIEFTFPRTVTWSLDEYASAIEQKLLEHNIESGWILAESFASQIAWAWIGQNSKLFRIDGLILAGGFVRHPVVASVQLAKIVTLRIPDAILKSVLWLYTVFARLRDGNSPEVRLALLEFVARRTKEDLLAAAHRLDLITESQWRSIAQTTNVPVFYLTGLIDPIVPWPVVYRWLRRNCAGYRDWKMIYSSDHHVLGSAKKAATHIAKWMHSISPFNANQSDADAPSRHRELPAKNLHR